MKIQIKYQKFLFDVTNGVSRIFKMDMSRDEGVQKLNDFVAWTQNPSKVECFSLQNARCICTPHPRPPWWRTWKQENYKKY